MMIIKKIILPLLIVLNFFTAVGQKEEVDFSKEIKQLNSYGKQVISSTNDIEKDSLNTLFKKLLLNVINIPDAFTSSFDSLKTISILKENELKIYNWAIPYTNGTFKYFAFVTVQQKNKPYQVIELIDKSSTIKTPENKTLTPKVWFGALYYTMINQKKLGSNYYTLLGWDGNNRLTNKKIIDVIQVTSNGSLKIGAPIFKMQKRTQRRVIFEYSKEAVMSLKYHPKLEKIVFDYLTPTSSRLKGIYEYYGPSLDTFDALILNKGKWIYEKNTEIMLDKSIKDRFWIDPEK